MCLQQENPTVHSHLEINSNHTKKVDFLRCRQLALFAVGLVILFAHCLRGRFATTVFLFLIIGLYLFPWGCQPFTCNILVTLSKTEVSGLGPNLICNYMTIPPHYRDKTVEIWMNPGHPALPLRYSLFPSSSTSHGLGSINCIGCIMCPVATFRFRGWRFVAMQQYYIGQ